MPERDVALSVLYGQAEAVCGTVAASDGDLWDDSTDIRLIPIIIFRRTASFWILLWDRATDSYKYIRYKAGRKTYTVYACIRHSKQSAKWNDL